MHPNELINDLPDELRNKLSCSPRGCSGAGVGVSMLRVMWIPFFGNVSKFLGFLVSKSQSFKGSWFLTFKVSWFHSFLVSEKQ